MESLAMESSGGLVSWITWPRVATVAMEARLPPVQILITQAVQPGVTAGGLPMVDRAAGGLARYVTNAAVRYTLPLLGLETPGQDQLVILLGI